MVSWQWTSWAVSELSSLFHWSVCSFLCQYMQLRLLEIYNAILKLGIVMIPAFFLLNTASDIQGLWGLQCCCAFFFFIIIIISLKNSIAILKYGASCYLHFKLFTSECMSWGESTDGILVYSGLYHQLSKLPVCTVCLCLALAVSDPLSTTSSYDGWWLDHSIFGHSLIEHPSWAVLIAWSLAIHGHFVSMCSNSKRKVAFQMILKFLPVAQMVKNLLRW